MLVTLATNVQLAPAAREAPEIAILAPEATAVIAAPEQVVLELGVNPTVNPVGKLLVKETPDSACALVLVTVVVRVVVLPD